MEDYLKEAITEGRAFDTFDQFEEMRAFIIERIGFFNDVFGKKWVDSTADNWSLGTRRDMPVIYKADLSWGIAQQMPEWLIYAYKKILKDYRKKIEEATK